MKAKKLLSKLDSIAAILNEYSFEELNVKDGTELKKSFDTFKSCLEKMVFQPVTKAEGYLGIDVYNEEVVPSAPKKAPQIENNATMLIANVSHEIRTPLNGIIGFTDLLKEEKLTENQLDKVEAIQTASQSLMHIINELLDYSKLTEGLEEIDQTDFNFGNVLDNVLYLCNTLITNDAVELKTNIDPSIPNILKGNPAKLSQVLLNLIGNSVKFVEEGEIRLDIQLKAKRNDAIVLEFTIADTGMGISKEHLAHIFDYFNQADKHTQVNYGGTGLGLSIVKKIIELSKGEISVASTLGKGTEFKFTLPYTVGDAQKITDENVLVIDSAIPDDFIKDKRILVFEDDQMNQRLFKQRLKFWGCKSYITENGKAGIKFLNEHEVDLVLMDLRMPGMNGFDITKEIRKSSNTQVSRIPIIAISADISAKEMNKCDAAGINDFILKPFSSEELMIKIDKNLKNKEAHIEEGRTSVGLSLDLDKKLNLQPLMDDCLGEVEIMKEMIKYFKQNAIEFIGASKWHFQNDDFEKLNFACHKIKSGLAMLNANTLLNLVEKIQVIAKKSQDKKKLYELYEAFIEEYLIVEQLMDTEIEKLNQ